MMQRLEFSQAASEVFVLHRYILSVDYFPSSQCPAGLQLPLGRICPGELPRVAHARSRTGFDIENVVAFGPFTCFFDDGDLFGSSLSSSKRSDLRSVVPQALL